MKKKTNLKEYIDGDTLDLSMSGLEEVPVKDIATFTKIYHLDLSNNSITQLTDNFPLCLTHITKLDLSHNNLISLPNNFGNLTNLRYLDLSKNKLPTVPLSFGDLKVLSWLDLSDNPLVPKISEVVGVFSSASECQQSAKKLVAFMAEVNKRVNIEKERIKEVKKLEAEQAELEMLKKKEKKDKKKKKKALKLMDSNGKSDMNEINHNEFMQQHIHSYSQVSRKTKPSNVWRFLLTLYKGCFYTVLLSLMIAFILKTVDEPAYDWMKLKVDKWARSTLPRSLVSFYKDNVKLSSLYGSLGWKRLTEFGQSVIEYSINWYNWFYTDETVQLFMDSLYDFLHVLYVQIMNLSIILYDKLNYWFQS